MYRNPPPHGGPPPYHQPPPAGYGQQGYQQPYDQPYEPPYGHPPYDAQLPYGPGPYERPPYDHRSQYDRRAPYEQSGQYDQPYYPPPYPSQGPPQHYDPYGQDQYARPPKRHRAESMNGSYPPPGEFQGPPPHAGRPPRSWQDYPPPPHGYDQPPDYPPYSGYPPPQAYPPQGSPRHDYPPHHGYHQDYQEPYPYPEPYQQSPGYPPPHGQAPYRQASGGRYRDDKLPRSIQWKRSEQPPEKQQQLSQSQTQASPSLASVHAAHGLPAPPASALQRSVGGSSILKAPATAAPERNPSRSASAAGEDKPAPSQVEFGFSHEDAESAAAADNAEQGDEKFYLDFDWDMPGRMPDLVPNPELQLGIIVWRPAVAVEHALAATAADAEAQLKMPPPRKRGKQEESLSKYITEDNLHELSIRQTDEWSKVKDDPVYFEFPNKDKIVPLEEVIANRRRPDGTAVAEVEMTDFEEGEVKQETKQEDEWNVLDSLEQALSPASEYSTGNKPSPPPKAAPPSQPPTTVFLGPAPSARLPTSIKYSSNHGPTPPLYSLSASKHTSPPLAAPIAHRIPPKPKAFPRDPSQENLLTSLGVTGSPQAVYETPGPARVPIGDSKSPDKQTRAGTPPYAGSQLTSHIGYGVDHANMHLTPPPPPRSESYSPPDPWTMDGQNAYRNSPAGSTRSARTLAGSDFHPEGTDDANGTNGLDGKEIIPGSLMRSESIASRKRAYEERENSEERKDHEKARQVDDVTPRFKRRQPRVAEAYSRRW